MPEPLMSGEETSLESLLTKRKGYLSRCPESPTSAGNLRHSEDQAETLFTVPWEVLQQRGCLYCFRFIARKKTVVL